MPSRKSTRNFVLILPLIAKHGAWIRVVVQALHRLQQKGLVGYFWLSHGEGVSGSRLWLKHRIAQNA